MVANRWVAALLIAAGIATSACAQGTSGPRVTDSAVGYIDPAIPGTFFRFRFDAADNVNRPTRAEFIYPKGAPLGPGLAQPDPRVNYQELFAYLEMAASDRFSAFVNVPFRFLEPAVNPNHAGFSDLDTGFKFAFFQDDGQVVTFQFRTYVPTGNSHLGLGTHHVSLEPGLLAFNQLTDRLALESELRLWVPVGGTDFAGQIIRYGTGLRYDLYRTEQWVFTPVTEFVGWTVLDGKESGVLPSGVAFVEGAAGQTILNVKVGARLRFRDRADIYVGYGRPLTGDRWYANIWRVAFRLFF